MQDYTSTHTQTYNKLKGFTIDDFTNDQIGVQYYTGLQDYLTFFDVLSSLGHCAYKLKYINSIRSCLSVPDQPFFDIDQV